METPFTAKHSELQLGDVINVLPDGSAFGTAVVYNLDENNVYVTRPYVVVGDFVHSGGVSTSIGEERFTLYRKADNGTVLVLRREDPEAYRRLVDKTVRAVALAIGSGDKQGALTLLANHWGHSTVYPREPRS